MKRAVYLILAALGLVSCQAQKESFSPESLAEKLQTPTQAEVTFDEVLKKHRGKTVLIEVWASWCGDCVKAMPLLKDTQAKFPNVDYVFISMDKTHEKWLEGIEKHALIGDHYFTPDGMKGSFGKSIDVNWIPRYIIVDKNGKVALYRAIEKDFNTINSTLEKLSK